MKRKSVFLLLSAFFFASSCTETKNSSDAAKMAAMNADHKVFVAARGTDPKSLDPHNQFDSVSGTLTGSVYDGLLSYHYLKRPYELIPVLIEKLPDFSDDGLTVTFQLRKGIKFHDADCFPNGKGRELVVDDVLYSIKRFSDISVNTRSWFLLDGAIKGLNALREKSKKSGSGKLDYMKENVEGLIKLTDNKFQVKLTQKNPLLLYAFAASSLKIVAHEAVGKYGRGFRWKPVGTGPFMLKEYRKKQTMILTKNPNYHMKYPTSGQNEDKKLGLLADAGKSLPLVDEVQLLYIPEAQPAMLKFKSGEMSWIGLDRDNFVQMAYKDEKGSFKLNKEFSAKYDIYTEPGLSMSYLSINMKDPLLSKNKDLRKALSYAFDVNKKIELLRNGRGLKLYTPVPQPIAGSETEIGQFGYSFDLAKAKEHLKKAGFPDGKGLPPIEMTMPGTSAGVKKSFEFVRNNFAQIGVVLKPDYKTWSAFLKSTEGGDFQLASQGWAADYPDAENFYQLFYGPNKAPGPNSSGFNNPEYNKLYEEIRYMENGAERNKKLARLSAILQEEVPIVLDYNPLVNGLVQKWVGNFKRNMMVDPPYAYLNIHPEVAAKTKF